jgi:hypothetical protein
MFKSHYVTRPIQPSSVLKLWYDGSCVCFHGSRHFACVRIYAVLYPTLTGRSCAVITYIYSWSTRVSSSAHLKTETDSFSKTLFYFIFENASCCAKLLQFSNKLCNHNCNIIYYFITIFHHKMFRPLRAIFK